jgi:hypothetical protein
LGVSENAHLRVGDRVCVHGEGFGRIVEIVERDEYPGGYAIVEIPRRDYHEASRSKIEWKERKQVLLDVYPPHLSRSAA